MTPRWITAALLLVASPLVAQEPVLEPGAKVRVTAPDMLGDKPQILTWAGYEDTQPVFLNSELERLELPAEAIESIEVSIGKQGHFWRGALIGLGASAVAGAIGCGVSDWSMNEPAPPCNVGEGFLGGAVLGLFFAAPIGGLIGGSIKTDVWGPGELPPPQTLVAVHPTGRFSVAVSIPLRR